jgi:hypothetical protein
MTNDELQELIKTTADNLSRIVNCGTQDDLDRMAELMLKDHRTLIQYKSDLFCKFFANLYAQYREGFFDDRNNHACRIAKMVTDGIEKMY